VVSVAPVAKFKVCESASARAPWSGGQFSRPRTTRDDKRDDRSEPTTTPPDDRYRGGGRHKNRSQGQWPIGCETNQIFILSFRRRAPPPPFQSSPSHRRRRRRCRRRSSITTICSGHRIQTRASRRTHAIARARVRTSDAIRRRGPSGRGLDGKLVRPSFSILHYVLIILLLL